MGIEIDQVDEDGGAVCKMALTPAHMNAGGAPQGGAIFTLADFTFAVASNSSGSYIVSIGCSISFMNAARGKVLYAKAVRRSQSRRISYYDVEVYDELQTPVAKMSVTGYNKNTPLAI